jgi:glycosyltransferase involved in cell wall biosynthesis
MHQIIELDSKYSTTRGLIKADAEDIAGLMTAAKKTEDKFETLVFLPEGEGRQGEGGLRTQGYFKVGGIIGNLHFGFKSESLTETLVNRPNAGISIDEYSHTPFTPKTSPLITVITVVFNGERFLEETILSVISQTYDNVEYIIIDGGSTDGTLDIIKKYEHAIDYWVSEKDNGMYEALHKGFSCASGSIFSWLNADDSYMPGAFKTVVDMMVKKNIEWVTGVPTSIDEFGGFLSIEHPKHYPKLLIKYGFFRGDLLGFIQQESTFFSSNLYRKSPLKTEFKLAGDFHLWCAFSRHDTLYTIKTGLASFRIHEGQKSSDMDLYLEECDLLSVSKPIVFLRNLKITNLILKTLIILMDLKMIKPLLIKKRYK